MNTLTKVENRIDGGREEMIRLTIAGTNSTDTRRLYTLAINDFWKWYEENGRPAMSLATVNRYRDYMVHTLKMKHSNVNVRLAAIRRLITAAAAEGLVNDLARGAVLVKGLPSRNDDTGRRLSAQQVEAFFDALPSVTLSNYRDRALVALAVGSGLRRGEIAALDVSHLGTLEGRPGIVGLRGKGDRERNVPVADWCMAIVREWLDVAGIVEGPVFQGVGRGKGPRAGLKRPGARITTQAIRNSLVRAIDNAKANGAELPAGLACHDLRRTFATLARKGKASIDQISYSLGHVSVATTERYLGKDQDFQDAPADHLGITLKTASRGMHAGRSMYL